MLTYLKRASLLFAAFSSFSSVSAADLSVLTMDSDFWSKSVRTNLEGREALGFRPSQGSWLTKESGLSLWGLPVEQASIIEGEKGTKTLEVVLAEAPAGMDDDEFRELQSSWFKLIDSEIGTRYNRLPGVSSGALQTSGLRWEAGNTLAVLSSEYVVKGGDKQPGAIKLILVPASSARDFIASYSGRKAGAAAGGGAGGQNTEVGRSLKGKLSRLEGKRFASASLTKSPNYFIFYYSASWCPPCRATASDSVRKFKSKIADNPNVELIHVSADRSEDAALAWAKQEKMPWLTVLPGKRTGIVGANYGGGIPRMILVDGSGKELGSAHPSSGFTEFLKLIK